MCVLCAVCCGVCSMAAAAAVVTKSEKNNQSAFDSNFDSNSIFLLDGLKIKIRQLRVFWKKGQFFSEKYLVLDNLMAATFEIFGAFLLVFFTSI